MEAATACVGKCPTVQALVNREALRSSKRLMRELFPRFEAIRHSVAHAAELAKDGRERHSVAGPYEVLPGRPLGNSKTRVVVRNSLQGRQFLNTFEGQMQSYEVSATTLDGLKKVKDTLYAAFSPVEAATFAKTRSKVTEI